MTTEERIEQLVYSKMCCGCPSEKFCHEECETCEEYEQELYYQLHPKEHIKYKHLTLSQKFEIYNAYQTGQYYYKEMCDKFHISQSTLQKVVKEVANIIYTKLKAD
jgi:hypothetical protein